MVKIRTGYLANIAGGMTLGFVLGVMVTAVPPMPLIYILAGGGVGAVVGGLYGGI